MKLQILPKRKSKDYDNYIDNLIPRDKLDIFYDQIYKNIISIKDKCRQFESDVKLFGEQLNLIINRVSQDNCARYYNILFDLNTMKVVKIDFKKTDCNNNTVLEILPDEDSILSFLTIKGYMTRNMFINNLR